MSPEEYKIIVNGVHKMHIHIKHVKYICSDESKHQHDYQLDGRLL